MTAGRGLLELARRVVTDQRFLFLAVGGFNVVQGVLWFALLRVVFGDSVPYLVLLALAYVPAILIGFTLYRVIVFRVQGHLVKDFSRFTLVQGAALVLNSVTLPFFHEILHIDLVVGQVLSVVVIVVFNYFAHMLFSFRRSHRHHDDPSVTSADTRH